MSIFCKLTKENQPVCFRYGEDGLEQSITYTDMPFQLLFAYEMLLFPLAGWSPVLERSRYMSYGISMSARLDKEQVEHLVDLKLSHIPEMAIASTNNSTDIFLPSRITREKAAAFLASAICLMRGESAPKFPKSLKAAPGLCHSLLTSKARDLPLPFRAKRREQLGQNVFIIRFHAELANIKQYDGWIEEHFSRFGEQDPTRHEMYVAVSRLVLQRYNSNMFIFSNEIRANMDVAAWLLTKEGGTLRSGWRHVAYRALCMSIPEAWAVTDPVAAPAFSLEVC